MKKIIIILLLFVIPMIMSKTLKASNHYTNFEDLTIVSGHLIDDYEEWELKDYYSLVKRPKFSGWKSTIINNKVKASFVSETLFSYYNDGYTSIDYTYKIDEQVISKYNFSATGSISVSADTSKTGFKSGLDASLKLSYSYDKQVQKKETFEIKVKVDPGTQVKLYVYGEGKITNGVAAKYFFWIRTSIGGFEVFEVSTQYQRLEKIKI